MSTKVTIKDIARKAGLSPATVSLVLNDRPSRISEQTKEQIRALAQEMGYHPNYAAVSLKTRRSYTLGLIIPDIRNDYYASYAKGMEDACQKLGYTMILCSTNSNPERERQYIETLSSKNIDGIALVVTPCSGDSSMSTYTSNQDLVFSLKIPMVQMDLTNYRPPANAVICNHETGGYMATRHLLSLGHRKILFISGPAGLEGSESRLEGCKKAFADYSLPWDEAMVYEGDYSYRAGLNAVDTCIIRNFTAVFAFNDLMACGVYNGLNKYNLSVPDDVSVVGYDDHFVSSILSVPLTTVRQPIYEMGKESARILIHASEDPSAEPVVSTFDLQLIVRKSTRMIQPSTPAQNPS